MALKHRSRMFVFATAAAALLFVSALPSQAEAQRRYRRVVVVGGGGYYYPYWAYRPWYQWGPYGYPPYGYPYVVADLTSALRLDVEPRQAQVFVDGYYAGIVDEFDGVFQRLRVQPGGHTITLYLEGYRTETQELYLRPGTDQRVRLTMQPIGPGEQSEPPAPPDVAAVGPGDGDAPYRPGPDERRGPEREPPQREVRPAPARFGTLSLRVQPADAEIFVDGQRWSGSPDQDRIFIQLPEGRHRVEVRKPGFATYTEEVLIRRDRTLSVNVGLTQ